MSAPELVITPSELQTGMSVVADFIAGGMYDDIDRQAAEVANEGAPYVIYAPAVKAMLDASLEILAVPSVEERLPREVMRRQNVAVAVAGYVSGVIIQAQGFYDHYGRDPELLGLMDASDLLSLNDQTYMQSIGQAPFSDVASACGGGVLALQERGITEPAPAVLARSKGLLAIAGIYKGYAEKASDMLGQPYIDPKHMEVIETESGTALRFTPATTEALRKFYVSGRGCPAARLASKEQAETLLSEYWRKIVHFLLPEGATVSNEYSN